MKGWMDNFHSLRTTLSEDLGAFVFDPAVGILPYSVEVQVWEMTQFVEDLLKECDLHKPTIQLEIYITSHIFQNWDENNF